MAAARVFDTSDTVVLFAPQRLFLKPIARLTINVMLPDSKLCPKPISNWEVMESLRKMVCPDQIMSLRVSRSTLDFIRFEGEVENKNLVNGVREKFNSRTLRVNGIQDPLRVIAVETQVAFPSQCDWESFFKNTESMTETSPGERADTIQIEGLPCKWFAAKEMNGEKPREEILRKVFGTFGEIRSVDIPMLDPYREEMTGKKFSTFSFGGLPTFEAFIQYQECEGFLKAMECLRGMKLMNKGEDGKALTCMIKVSFDTTKHLSEAAIRKRDLERLKLQELEKQREAQKQRDEEEEQSKEAERKRRDEEREREKGQREKLRRKELRQREREERLHLQTLWMAQMETEKEPNDDNAWKVRKLVLAERKLESYKLLTVLLNRAECLVQKETEFQKNRFSEKCPRMERKLGQLEEVRQNEAGVSGSGKPKVKEWQWVGVLRDTNVGKPRGMIETMEHSLSPGTAQFPLTTSLSNVMPADSEGRHTFVDLPPNQEKAASYRRSESLQITVRQDCAAFVHKRQDGDGDRHNCSCQGHSRKVTAVNHQIRHHLYKYEDFVSCLLNYRQTIWPLDSKRANRFHSLNNLGENSEWRRIVSNNGNSFQIDLKNNPDHLYTKFNITEGNKLKDYDNGRGYRWTITVSETGAKRRACSTEEKHPINGYEREFHLPWKDSCSQLKYRPESEGEYELQFKGGTRNSKKSCAVPVHDQSSNLSTDPGIPISSAKAGWVSPSKASNPGWVKASGRCEASNKSSGNDPGQPDQVGKTRTRVRSKCPRTQPKAQCKVAKLEPVGFTKEDTQQSQQPLKRLSKRVKRTRQGDSCELSNGDCGSDYCQQEAWKPPTIKKFRKSSRDIKPTPGKSTSEASHFWEENKRKYRQEFNNCPQESVGHQKDYLWIPEGSEKNVNQDLVLDDPHYNKSKMSISKVKHRKKGRKKEKNIHPKDKPGQGCCSDQNIPPLYAKELIDCFLCKYLI
uniref:Uncharacterized LOC103178385 n=1 Tax=Callorhinchus milii TaxID=7868 RepID=A0A4W3JKD7_CALMI|eukprot:gi/632935789/ref/XP_007891292.1/ PREDICTED: uncharacterized protein LOC103178385 isoform X2 [Callorhinchus milii]